MTVNTTVGGFAPQVPELLQDHFEALSKGSGLTIEVIRERGYRSVLGKQQLQDLGFSKSQARVPGLLVPVHVLDGTNSLHSYKPDIPRIDGRGKTIKYELPKGVSARLDVPPRCLAKMGDPSVDLWITEGSKKADALAQHGLCAVALLGVWNFKGKNDFGGTVLLSDFDLIAFNGRKVNIAYDSDVMVKPGVRAALERLTEHIQRKGAIVTAVYLPNGPDGAKMGVDDYLLRHTIEELKALVTEPRPVSKVAALVFELLDEAPSMVSQPLSLVKAEAYAATWLWAQKTESEGLNKQGDIVRYDPPRVTKERMLFIVRHDGKVFNPDQIDELGLEIKLSDTPLDDRLWSKARVTAYDNGSRPDYENLFGRLCSVYDYLLDFGHSFGSQLSMCELSSCFSLMTWFGPAFSVFSYPWPNGEKGCGKTKWGHCWTNTSYLGRVILASGTFAALRDLADYGATLLFDDAENLGDPRKCDPDKQALLLAGNRRGTSVPIKEPVPGGKGWQVRWVNAFCPRGFTSISLPDPVLGSRSIRIPLVRTADPKRGNSDPSALERWPCDWRQLQDDLWAASLSLLSEASGVWAELDNETELVGREFEPWRPIIAVARLFERHGVEGLEDRMRQAMRDYQEEKSDVNTGDRAVQILRAILFKELGDQALDVLDISTVLAVYSEKSKTVVVQPKDLAETIKEVGQKEDWDTDWASSRAVGWQLKALRWLTG
ncbi:MAG: DUF3854 domain-containing protein [Chloroflexi bacterium]|nr:DUF3854 domain-containing protein [Chloroflexota bacterium]